MIKNLKREQGITLITLIITVVLLVIITSILAKNTYSSLQLSNLTKLQNDVESLNDRVAAYYVKNGNLPIHQVSLSNGSGKNDTMTKSEVRSIVDKVSPYDNDNYYVLDIEKLDNVTLNYGKEYKIKSSTDKYVIHEETHMIYYLKGIYYEGEEYHTIGLNKGK